MTSSSDCQRQSPVLRRENFDVKGSVRSIDTKTSGNSSEARLPNGSKWRSWRGKFFRPVGALCQHRRNPRLPPRFSNATGSDFLMILRFNLLPPNLPT